MRIAIIGIGGVGGYFGGRLAQTEHEVTFIVRGAHLQAIQRDGLQITSSGGDFVAVPTRATDDPAEVGEADAVLLCVKTWQVQEACRMALPMLGSDTAVVTLQNGVEAPQQAAEVVGPERVLPGLVKVFSYIEAPGHIRHVGKTASITFGEAEGGASERVQRLASVLREAGLKVEPAADVQAALWSKFLFVVPLGGVGAVTRAPIGVTRSLPETRNMLEEAMREIVRVGRARGVDVPEDAVARAMAFTDAQPEEATISLQRDLAAGRPSELEAWSGAVVRMGEEVGVATPLHRFIYHSLLPLERRARGALAFAD